MARKRYEFKPDRTGTGDWKKLALTQKQRSAILRWALLGAFCLLALIVQDVVMSRVSLLGATTDLLPCVVILACILQGAERGCVFTLVMACVYGFSGSAPGIYVVPLLTGVGVVAATFRQGYLRQNFGAVLLCATVAVMGYELLLFAAGLMLGRTLPARLGVFVLTGVLSSLVLPLAYPVLRAIGKIGGEVWNE